MRRGILGATVALASALTSCSSGIALRDPAPSPPGETPYPVVETLTVSGDQAVDFRDITGFCVWLYLWAEGDAGAEWLPVALNTMLVTSDFHTESGREEFCDLKGNPGPQTYDLPMSRVPDGWYTVCSLSSECSEPFEKA